MNIIYYISAFIVFMLIFAIFRQYLGLAGMIVLIAITYTNQVATYYDLFAISTTNYILAISSLSFIISSVMYNRNILNKLNSNLIKLLFIFWGLYLFSGFFSVILYEVNIRMILLIGIRVIALLFAGIQIHNIKEIFFVIFITMVLGIVDFLGDWTSRVNTVLLGTRNLGFLPWLREDTIWLAQGIFVAYLVTLFPRFKYYSNIGKSFWARVVKVLVLFILLWIFLYGIAVVQIRAYAIEFFVSLVLAIFITRNARIIPYLFFITIITLTVIYLAPATTVKEQAIIGLFQRDSGGRLFLWQEALRYWLQSPLWGHGFGSDGILISRLGLSNLQSSHSVYILLAIETGVIGLILWIYLNIKAIFLTGASIQEAQNVQEYFMILSILLLHISLLIHLFFHALVYFPWTVILPAISFSLFEKTISQKNIRTTNNINSYGTTSNCSSS